LPPLASIRGPFNPDAMLSSQIRSPPV